MKEKCVLTEYMVSAGLPGKLRIGLISDLHERASDRALVVLRQSNPDLIMVAGDTLERHGMDKDTLRMSDEGIPEKLLRRVLMKADDAFEFIFGEEDHNSGYAYRFLREAGKIAPVCLSLGNHEWFLTPEDLEVMKESGVKLLDNGDCEVELKGTALHIGGLSSVPDLAWLNGFCGKEGYKILLCHHPEYYDQYLRGREVDLILAGHAHGGQIRIGNRGIYAPGQGLFPKYTKGVYDEKLVVTAGVSNTASIPRWGNPCEVVILRLE